MNRSDYTVFLDVWEGNPDLDVPTLLQAGVKGMVVRLNDMAGGHHKDELFDKLWAIAAQFPARCIYFVYNPWVSAAENHRWLMANLPAGYTGLILPDVEVRYAAKTPPAYYADMVEFIRLVRQTHMVKDYTSAGYLDMLSMWPNMDYWWARYPYSLYPSPAQHITWEEFYRRMEAEVYPDAASSQCPGTVWAWQCTGDRLFLPGMGNHAVDINIFPGPVEELINEFSGKGVVNHMLYSNRAKLFELNDDHVNVNIAKIGGPISGVIAFGGAGETIAKQFTAHVDQTAKLGLPCIMRWKVSAMGGNTGGLYDGGNPAKGFPAPADDWQIKAMRRALYMSGNIRRAVHAIMLDITEVTNEQGKLTQSWLKNVADFILNAAYSQFALPMYVYMRQDVLDSYGSAAQLTDWLSSDNIGICSWKSANPGGAVQHISWDALPTPPDTYVVPYVANNKLVYFSKFASTLYTLDGITDGKGLDVAVPLWMYKGDQKGLFSDLNFKAPAAVTPVTPTEPTTPTTPTAPTDPTNPTNPTNPSTPTTGDITTVLQAMQTLQADVKEIKSNFVPR